MRKPFAAFAGTVQRIVRSVLAIRTERLFHPDSPGVRVLVTRSRFGMWFKPADFATIGETIAYYIANADLTGKQKPEKEVTNV